MQLKVRVYVSNVTNLSDARYCAGMGVDFLGFPIGRPEQESLSLETFHDIVGWVTGPALVFEYNNNVDQNLLEKVTEIAAIEYVRVKASQVANLPSQLNGKSLIVDGRLEDLESVKHQSNVKYFILPEYPDGEADEIRSMNDRVPLLIHAQGLQTSLDQIENLPITGIVLEGTAEEKPGRKDYEALATVLEQLEDD